MCFLAFCSQVPLDVCWSYLPCTLVCDLQAAVLLSNMAAYGHDHQKPTICFGNASVPHLSGLSELICCTFNLLLSMHIYTLCSEWMNPLFKGPGLRDWRRPWARKTGAGLPKRRLARRNAWLLRRFVSELEKPRWNLVANIILLAV